MYLSGRLLLISIINYQFFTLHLNYIDRLYIVFGTAAHHSVVSDNNIYLSALKGSSSLLNPLNRNTSKSVPPLLPALDLVQGASPVEDPRAPAAAVSNFISAATLWITMNRTDTAPC